MVDSNIIHNYVKENFSAFGMSKRREIVRLLFEIAKREKKDYQKIAEDIPYEKHRFTEVRSYLLKRRYPDFTKTGARLNISFPELEINPGYRVEIKDDYNIEPFHFVVEESVLSTPLVKRLKEKYSAAEFTVCSSYKTYTGGKRYGITDYNNRTKDFFIIRENYDFYKSCPCSNDSVFCGYHVVNLGSGCPYECTYCYLQDYINSPGIVMPGNLEDFFKEFENYRQNVRMGSGELTDSLVYDHITEYSPRIVEFFKKHPKSTFEFKTKSSNVGLLLSVSPGNNIVVSWSVNPQKITETIEHYTASLKERLQAARQCARAGYNIVFHFDPIIYYLGWEKDYEELVHQIFDTVDAQNVGWVSLGTLRMTPRLKKIIENRFPQTGILDEEFLPGYDGKMRYSDRVRADIYQKMKQWIQARGKDIPIYLCMEEKTICKQTETLPTKKLLNSGR